MNEYEARQEEKRARLLEAAEKAGASSRRHMAAAQRISSGIPPGQPILVGHHSEKRHRRDLARIDTGYRKSAEATERERDLLRRAAAVGKGGISSDDPEAIVKLREKLEDMEAKRTRMKAVNAAWRKAGKPGPEEVEGWTEVAKILWEPLEGLQAIRLSMANDFLSRAPYTWELTNLGGNIRRVQKRIEALQREWNRRGRNAGTDWVRYAGFALVEAEDANRIRIHFDEKPPRPICQLLRAHGWRYSPTVVAWQRHLNNSGRASAANLIPQLE